MPAPSNVRTRGKLQQKSPRVQCLTTVDETGRQAATPAASAPARRPRRPLFQPHF